MAQPFAELVRSAAVGIAPLLSVSIDSDGGLHRLGVRLACRHRTLSRHSAQGEDDNCRQNAEDDDDDEEFDKGESTFSFASGLLALDFTITKHHFFLPFVFGREGSRRCPLFSSIRHLFGLPVDSFLELFRRYEKIKPPPWIACQ